MEGGTLLHVLTLGVRCAAGLWASRLWWTSRDRRLAAVAGAAWALLAAEIALGGGTAESRLGQDLLAAGLSLGLVAATWKCSHDLGVERARRRSLEQAEERLLSSLRANPHPISLVDIRSAQFIAVNAAFTELTGLSEAEVVGRRSHDLNFWRDSNERTAFNRQVLEQGVVNEFEWTYHPPGGEERILRLAATHLELRRGTTLLTVGHDITEQRRATLALAASKARFSAAFHDSPDAIVITGLADGRIHDVNEGFCRITGYVRAEVLGKTVAEIGLWNDLRQRRAMVETLSEVGTFRDADWIFRRRDGALVRCRVSGARLDINGEACLLAIARDVTALVEAEFERLALIEDLEAGNAQLERFTETVSHDLRAPLSEIHGRLAALDGTLFCNDDGTDRIDLEDLRREGAEMRAVLESMAHLLDTLLVSPRGR